MRADFGGQQRSDQPPSQIVRDAIDAHAVERRLIERSGIASEGIASLGLLGEGFDQEAAEVFQRIRRGRAIPIDQAHLAGIADQDIRHVAVAMDRHGRDVEPPKGRGCKSQFLDQPFDIDRKLGLCRRHGSIKVLDLVKDALAPRQRLSRLEQAPRGNDRIDDRRLQHPFQRTDPPAVVQVLHDEDAVCDVGQHYPRTDTEIGCALRRLEGTGYVDVKLRVAIHHLDENALAIRLLDGSPGEAIDAAPAWRRQNGDCGFDRDVSRPPARKGPEAVPECGHFDCCFAHSYVRSLEIWEPVKPTGHPAQCDREGCKRDASRSTKSCR